MIKRMFILFLCASCITKTSYTKEYRYSEYVKTKSTLYKCNKIDAENSDFSIFLNKKEILTVNISNNDILIKLLHQSNDIEKIENVIYNNIFSELCHWGYIPEIYEKNGYYIIKPDNKFILKRQIEDIFNLYLN